MHHGSVTTSRQVDGTTGNLSSISSVEIKCDIRREHYIYIATPIAETIVYLKDYSCY